MPVDVPKPPKGKKGKGGARIFGFPWYVVAGGVVAAIALGLYLRHRSTSSGSSGTTAAPAQDTSGGAGGGSSTPSDALSGQTADLSGIQDQINGLWDFLSTSQSAPPQSDYAPPPAQVAPVPIGGVDSGYVWPAGLDPSIANMIGQRGGLHEPGPSLGNFVVYTSPSLVTHSPSKAPVRYPSQSTPPVTNRVVDHPALQNSYPFALPSSPETKVALTEHRAPPGGF